MMIIAKLAVSLLLPVHSWYPSECCSSQDCVEISAPVEVHGGFRFGDGQFAPYDKVRMSPDGKWHVCKNGKYLRCVFGPIGGF